MQKVVQYLEMYVQWLALALGLGFLGYMAWTYVYKNPASQEVQIGPETVTVTPSNVDQLINNGPGSRLEDESHQSHAGFQIPVPPITAVNINPTTQPVELAGMSPVDAWPIDIKGNGTGPKNNALVQALPDLPALKYVDQEPLRTVLLINGSNGQTSHQDQDSVTTFWSLPIKDLAQSFTTAFGGKLPQPQQLATFINVIVMRQEQLPNGKWSDPVQVALPPLPPGTAPQPEYPSVKDPQATQKFSAYQQWAVPLHQWFVNAPYPAVAYTRQDLQWQPLAQWIPYRAYAQAAEDAPLNAPAPTPPPPPPPPRQMGGPEFGGPFGGFGGPPPGRGGGPPPQIFAPPPVQQQQAPPPASQPTTQPVIVPPIPQLAAVPPAGFNPTTQVAQGDMEIWFHDMTVVPGKVYRYQIRYVLLNPVYGLTARVANPALAADLGMASPFSSWSDSVIVPPRTRFWCSSKQPAGDPNNPRIAFIVYNWHDGQWQEKDYICGIGDEVGADEGAAGNFVARWTLLSDVRTEGEGSRHYALLVSDDGGDAQQRDVDSDIKSLDYLKFKRDFDAQQALQPQDQSQQPAAQIPMNGPPG
ncbi:MAG TPA: hypothetical protein VL992_08705 [Tepidisphaeraceae bacterium]|nr:hypothetical protein [Tepidisphaeraceae bacterium]